MHDNKLALTYQAEIPDIKKKMNGVKGWLSPREGELLYNIALNCTGKGVIVEIGSYKGRSTIWLASGSKRRSGDKVYAIDPHLEKSFEDFKINIKNANVDDIVIPLVMTSEEASLSFDLPIELIFIDGCHDYDFVRKDFDLWFPKIVEGGIMAFHDTISWPGPEKVVEEALYKSRNFKDVRLSVQITYAKKVGRNTVKDMLESRYRLFARHLGNGYREFLQNMRTSGQRMRFPKPVRKILGHVLRLIE